MAEMNRPNNDSWRALAAVAALAAVVVAVYLPMLFNGFVSYDDHLYVTDNEMVQRGLSYEGLVWAFTTFHSYNWHPLTWLSHMLDVQLFGLNAMGHHLVNLLFHLANTLLLFAMLRKGTGAFWRSLLVAALFALHPLHVESVAWVAERKDVLSTFFCFLALWSYLAYARSGALSRYALSVLCLVLGLLAKPMLVTLPIMLLLLDYWPLGRIPGLSPASGAAPATLARLALEKIPFALLALASCVVTYLAQSQGGAVIYSSTALQNAGNALISYLKYLVKTVWPHPLAPLYPYAPTAGFVAGAAAILLLSSLLFLSQWRRHPYLTQGWLWFLGTLIPVIGFVRIGQHSIADRYTYVPLIGIFVMAVWGVGELREKRGWPAGGTAAATAALLAVLATLTVLQQRYWRDTITLFEHTVAVTRGNFTAHKTLAVAYGRKGDLARATHEHRVSRMLGFRYRVRVWPDDHLARYGLATVYQEMGMLAEAVAEYREAARLKPGFSQAHNDMGIALAKEGKIPEARQAFEAALRADPGNGAAAGNLRALSK